MRIRSGSPLRAIVTASIGLILLTSCAATHDVHSIFERERVATDELPSHVIAELDNVGADIDSSRLAGTDSDGGRYYVTEGRENNSFCVVIVLGDSGDEWVQGCGVPPVTVAIPPYGVSATLFAEPTESSSFSEEVVGDHILVTRQ